ncbi:MAG: response regulator transcription factor [Acidimicrobiales bacterium]|nr:response regulator transcription factor [Acidimicrobiales bacterium]
MLVSAELLPELGDHTTLFDDFCLTPFHPAELEARLDHLLIRSDGDDAIITYGPLSLNVETYQAMIDRRPLDLTYMEYELLRYLTASPGKVFSREILLSEVWGYDYYGGARTVDVHIRRLRSKLGEEHANLISTVRSVGYRLGQAKWT